MSAAELGARARQYLGTLDRADDLQLDWVEAVDSTNAALLARGCPPPGGWALVAQQQSAGRGRQGRSWHSAAGGGLCLSLALSLPAGPASAMGLSLAAGVAVAETLQSSGVASVALKWPNDIWVEESKLGGLLIELNGRAAACYAVIGLGLNIDQPAGFDPGQPWTDLARLGVQPDRAVLVAQLLSALCEQASVLRREGVSAVLPRWRRFDLLQGRRINVRCGNDELVGQACGIDERGGLRVLHADGERIYLGGDVSLRPA
ncbi:biotin--[acetyl-CoA-carboxylase] ligase [Aquimonas sp.]|jgi:BirA family biotin operon repressor/biotin-[acetyl-CoA-carboxylase] ligase|uniref:biotin--[acetyl-CoA-carboxylase] ligase n=1 Tax=Aquimonas sp. TaxID=1872588 RepID=UPI0037C14369